MTAKSIVLANLIILFLSSAATADIEILASYETSESITLSSPDNVNLSMVTGGENNIPAAVDGSKILKATWNSEPDGKIEIKHQWAEMSFNLAGWDNILVDVYMPNDLSAELMGIWDSVFGWQQAICPPPIADRWYTISFDITDYNDANLNAITALVIEGINISAGTLYFDNLRLSRGLPINTTVEIQDDWFYVNGEKFFVKGMCFFEWDLTGGRSSMGVLDYKFRKIKQAGFNTIRSWLQPAELELARQHGLMVMQGANHLCFSHEYLDPNLTEQIKNDTQEIVGYSAPYNNILYYIIDNEPYIHNIYNQGEDAITNFYNELIDVARGVQPNIILSMASFPPVAFLDYSIFDCVSLNLYPFGPAENSLGYQKYLEWFKKEHATNKPLIISEYGWDVVRGEAEFSKTMMELLDKQLNANATGAFFYTWQSFDKEGVGDNLWFGIVPNDGNSECYLYPPRDIYYDYKEYFEAVVINPKDSQLYTETIPVEVYGSDRTASVEAVFEGTTYNLTKTGTYWWQCDIAIDGNLSGEKNITIISKDGAANTLVTKQRTINIGSQPQYNFNISKETEDIQGGQTYRATVSVTDANDNPVPYLDICLGLNETGTNVWSSIAISATTNAQGKYEFSSYNASCGYLTLMAGIDSEANPVLSVPAVDTVRVEAPPVSQGVKYDYYKGSWSSLPDFESLTPVKSGRAAYFFITPEFKYSDYFAMRFTGYINIDTDGTYFFYINSDDGSKLYINNTLVVDNDGLHGPDGDVAGSIELQAGRHLIAVEYFEATGWSDLVVSYTGPGIPKQPISGSVLSWCNFNGDFDENCRIDLGDLNIIATRWLTDYNFLDFTETARDWLKTEY